MPDRAIRARSLVSHPLSSARAASTVIEVRFSTSGVMHAAAGLLAYGAAVVVEDD